MRRAACQGVSSVELVVIITMIGLLAAFAIPRFNHLQNDVRTSEVVALSLSLRMASESAHSLYVKSGDSPAVVNLGGKLIRLRNGYPDASAFGIRQAADLSEFSVHASGDSVVFERHDAPAGESCSVTYSAAASATKPAVVENLRTSGC